ncbi:TIGR01906 family membrane protein [Arthrobacter silviterrae]|uniref:TIGR01906 family membrane protein n=2 Tax=Arthrobacter silviterrae TaxID=2026658 RepID=A0ABX0D9R7_9MICC|nr:TIGR01906 family membrane protein [Arthrobacter silviterrae]NGN83638.1 TIGR01906 family membrane protein [Arthrobacter silviterrae]
MPVVAKAGAPAAGGAAAGAAAPAPAGAGVPAAPAVAPAPAPASAGAGVPAAPDVAPAASPAGAAPGAPASPAPAGGAAPAGGTASSSVPVKPEARIKLDAPADGSEPEPMRPARRLPKLPEVSAAGSPSTPTAALQVQHSDKRLEKTRVALEQAARTKPVLPRVFQVLLAVFYPVVLLVLAIRLVTTPYFLWVEYHRPGFPADSFGFSTDDRMTYGSYTVDYLLNLSGARYLGDLVNSQHNQLFLAREVAHMADVKTVITTAFVIGLVLAVGMVIAMVYLARRSVGGIRRGLFAGSIVTLVIIIVLGVLAGMGWETFFTDFHHIFFANGTWTFYTDDTLIRLFPSEFWLDSGIFIGAFVLVVASLTMAFTWPTAGRRQAVTRSRRPGRRTAVVG